MWTSCEPSGAGVRLCSGAGRTEVRWEGFRLRRYERRNYLYRGERHGAQISESTLCTSPAPPSSSSPPLRLRGTRSKRTSSKPTSLSSTSLNDLSTNSLFLSNAIQWTPPTCPSQAHTHTHTHNLHPHKRSPTCASRPRTSRSTYRPDRATSSDASRGSASRTWRRVRGSR